MGRPATYGLTAHLERAGRADRGSWHRAVLRCYPVPFHPLFAPSIIPFRIAPPLSYSLYHHNTE